MPAKWFKCPDGELQEIAECLSVRGCRMRSRCATVPYLRKSADDRVYKAITPSHAGTGVRVNYLKEVCDYIVDPNDKAFAVIGQGSHGKLSTWYLTRGFVAEEGFTDDIIKGIPDLLEPDEEEPGYYILYDYKTSGSYKVMLALGLIEDKDNPKLTKAGNVSKYRSGWKKGRIIYHLKEDREVAKANILDWSLQLNRYRIVVEENDFPVSKTIVQAIPRDGNTQNARGNGIFKNIYLIKIPRLDDKYVLDFYQDLVDQRADAFVTGNPRICNAWENWDKRRCKGFCPVKPYCDKMEKDGAIYMPKETE